LEQMRKFTYLDVSTIESDDPEKAHMDDLIAAACIAFQMRDFAKVSVETRRARRSRSGEEPYETPSIAGDERKTTYSGKVPVRERSSYRQQPYEPPNLD